MNHQLICDWLDLPGDKWPPDHYRLLGLESGESDAATIEQHIHDRVDKVRRYQLIHPEQATEALNRLAQAFVCLTDSDTKQAYDAKLKGIPLVPSIRANGSVVKAPVITELATETVPFDLPIPVEPIPLDLMDTQIGTTLPQPAIRKEPPPPAVPPTEKRDPVLESARESHSARRGLETKRALCRRIARTRGLLRAWQTAEKYVGDPNKRIVNPFEATELIQQLTTIRELLHDFPPLLGVAGRPGYLVLALARLQVIVPTFQTLLPSQREALARDWQIGHKVLRAHRQFLRHELKAMRRRSLFARMFRVMSTAITEHSNAILILLALIALVVSLFSYSLARILVLLFPSQQW